MLLRVPVADVPAKAVSALRALAAPFRVRTLGRSNAGVSRSALGEAPVIVSLTSHGRRLETAHLAIESIAAGTVRPSRLILWVDDEATAADPPVSLRRLAERGVEIRATRPVGPYAKFYPTLAELAPGQFLATADDDVIYPRRWLERLLAAGLARPDLVHCYRARWIRLDGDGLASYRSWPLSYSTAPGHRRFLLGVSGALHPPRMAEALRRAGDGFLSVAPRADDVWLNSVAAAHGLRVRQVSRIPWHFPLIPGSQEETLLSSNVAHEGNDAQLAAAYTAPAIAAVRGERRRGRALAG